MLAGKLTVGADPTDDMDVATKKYVDEKAGSGSGSATTPDWSVEDSTADGYIANKPAIKAGSAENSIIEGSSENTASGNFAHCEGSKCTASGICSHAEGVSILSSGYYSHSEGAFSQASGNYSHSEGNNTKAKGSCSHAEGIYSTASGENSHAEGTRTVATGNSSHVCGRFNIEDTENKYAEIVGNGTVAVNGRSNARTLDWEGNEVLAGKLTVGTAPTEDMEVATKKYVDEKAGGTTPDWNVDDKSADGYIANKPSIKAGTGEYSLMMVLAQEASGTYSSAEGASTVARGYASHAEGYQGKATGDYSHAEGSTTEASGKYGHEENVQTEASGVASHAEGYRTIAAGECSHVSGRCNIEDKENKYAEIIGNGSYDTGTRTDTRSNARTLYWSGNEVLAGKLTVGASPTEDMDVTTKKYVDDLIAELQAKIDALAKAG